MLSWFKSNTRFSGLQVNDKFKKKHRWDDIVYIKLEQHAYQEYSDGMRCLKWFLAKEDFEVEKMED